jgi:hypothetical protein
MQFDQTTIFILGTAVIIGSWIVVNQLNRARERETREEQEKTQRVTLPQTDKTLS